MMKNECNSEEQNCGDLCKETRKEVFKIMLGFAIIIGGLGYYILSEGIVTRILAH